MKYKSSESKLVQSQKTQEVSLGLADHKKAIELLYSQYNNPIQTCVQELVCNAWDAMKMAEKEHLPIKVTLPNALNDYHISFRDFGTSMTPHIVKTVYMRINASTKSKENISIGGFGIGSKTPWAYTDTFILKTFLDGKETHYLMVRGRSKISIIYTGETVEPNGVEVTFKTKESDKDMFKKALERICLFADTIPLVNLPELKGVDDEMFVTPSIRFVRSGHLEEGEIYFNIGGVPYKLPRKLLNNTDSRGYYTRKGNEVDIREELEDFTNNSSLVIDAPIGSIYPLQTREGLFTEGDKGELNKAMIKKLAKYALKKIQELAEKKKQKVVDTKSAIDYFGNGLMTTESRFNFGDITVNSRELQFAESEVSIITRSSKRYRRDKVERGRKDRSKYIRYDRLKGTVYFSELPANKARLISRFHDTCFYNDVIVFEKELMKPETYEFLKEYYNAVNIETVAVPKRKSTSTGKKDSTKVVYYDYYGDRIGSFNTTDDFHRDVVVFEKGSGTEYGIDFLRSVLDAKVIFVAPNNIKKCLALPNFYTEEELVKKNEEKIVNIVMKHRLKKGVEKLSLKNERVVMNYLSNEKQRLFEVYGESQEYLSSGAIEYINSKHGNTIDRLIKKALKRRERARRLVLKAPLALRVDTYRMPETAKKHLEDYIKTQLGEACRA